MLGRFASADSIVPAGAQGYDRYAYVNNSPVNFNDPTGHFPPNPFKYDTVSIGFHGLLKAVFGVDLDLTVNINAKALKESYESAKENISNGKLYEAGRDLSNVDYSVNVGATVSGGISLEDAVGVSVSGNNDTVLDQSDVQIVGRDGEVSWQTGGCIFDGCGAVSYTKNLQHPDENTGEGYFFGVGADPAAIDISLDLVGVSDHFLYGRGFGEEGYLQFPFLNEGFKEKSTDLFKEVVQ